MNRPLGNMLIKRDGDDVRVSMDFVFFAEDCDLVNNVEYRYTIPAWEKTIRNTLEIVAGVISRRVNRLGGE